jgi:hypothetical protein
MTRLALLALAVSLSATLVASRIAADDLQVIAGQPCWVLESDQVRLAVTRTGAHMAPVTFNRSGDQPIEPYYISPWQEEGLDDLPVPVLVPLRGDFFCMPFGGNAEEYNGEKHPPHGEVAGSDWQLNAISADGRIRSLSLVLKTEVRSALIFRELLLREGDNAVYSRVQVNRFAGPTPYGHHATLRMPETPESLKVQSSPFRFGMTNPTQFSNPENREYQSLAINAGFESLESIPTIFADDEPADCTLFPARTGYADLLAVFKEPNADGTPAWMTAINRDEDYLWFSLKDAGTFPATVFWIENHGRHASPWNGRNNCLGLEDVCAYFADGLVPSIEDNLLTQHGVRTSAALSNDVPFEVRYIQGAIPVPDGFDTIADVRFEPGQVTFVSDDGREVSATVHHEFLQTAILE